MSVIYVKDIIQSKIAVSPEKGQLLYNYLLSQIRDKRNVKLSFKDIDDLTTAFLNKAIGNLYHTFSSETLNQYLSVTDIDDLDKYLLQKVIARAKMDIQSDKELSSKLDEVFGNE